jgi:hypothetical protein
MRQYFNCLAAGIGVLFCVAALLVTIVQVVHAGPDVNADLYDSGLFMGHNTRCRYGEKQGHWMNDEWHTFPMDAKCILKQFFKPMKTAGSTSRLVVDPLLAGRSVLLRGDSTDRNKL